MNNEEIKNIANFIKSEEENKQNKYEIITKKALELFNKKQTAKFIEFYKNEVHSIAERIEALEVLLSEVLETENYDWKKVLKFRESISKSKNNDFIYLFDDVIFQLGSISPEEFIKTIDDGIKKQIPMAYVIKSFFYYYGLDNFEESIQAIEKAILLEPTNIEFKKIRKELENKRTALEQENCEEN